MRMTTNERENRSSASGLDFGERLCAARYKQLTQADTVKKQENAFAAAREIMATLIQEFNKAVKTLE